MSENEAEGSGEFSVWQFFMDETSERVLQNVDARTTVEKAKALTLTVGGRIGTTARIIITDCHDNTCFEWKHRICVTVADPSEVSCTAAGGDLVLDWPCDE